MTTSLDDYISAGNVLTQFIDGAAPNSWMRNLQHATDDLLPGKFLSVGFWGAPIAPVFTWMGPTDEDYVQFGIPPDRISELTKWADERFDQEIGYPNLVMRLETAREYMRRFTNGMTEMQLIGMGLHKEYLGKIAEIERLNPRRIDKSGATVAGFEGGGFAQAVKLAKPVIPGEILGFDVIALRDAIDHSWHCNGLALTGLREFGFRPNSIGLLDDRANAEKIARYAEEKFIEDRIWLPLLLIRYPLQSV